MACHSWCWACLLLCPGGGTRISREYSIHHCIAIFVVHPTAAMLLRDETASSAASGSGIQRRRRMVGSSRTPIPLKQSRDEHKQVVVVGGASNNNDNATPVPSLSIPTEIVERIVDAALNSKNHYGTLVDCCGQEYKAIALINRQFFGAYLEFFGRMAKMSYSESPSGLGQSDPSVVRLWRFGAASYDQKHSHKSTYIVPKGLVKLMAQQGLLRALKEVQVRADAKRLCRDLGSKTPVECLLQLLGIDYSTAAPNKSQNLHAEGGDKLLALDYARVELVEGESLSKGNYTLDMALGLNASRLEIRVYTHLLPSGVLLSSPPTVRFDRITQLRLVIWPGELPLNLPLSKRLRNGGASHHELDPFPGDVTLMERLVAVCVALKTLKVEYVFGGSSPVNNKALTRYRNSICALYDRVGGASEQLRNATTSIKIEMFHVIWGAETWPRATLRHPLFQLGALVENRLTAWSSETIREMVLFESDVRSLMSKDRSSINSNRNENGGSTRKVLVWSASCTVHTI